MGIVEKKVLAGINDYLATPAASGFHAAPGSEKMVELLNDEPFLKAIIDGSKTIDSSWGMPTAKGVEAILNKIDDVAEQNGGSYEPLYLAYQESPDDVISSISKNDMKTLAVAFQNNIPQNQPETQIAQNDIPDIDAPVQETETAPPSPTPSEDIRVAATTEHTTVNLTEPTANNTADLVNSLRGGIALSNNGSSVLQQIENITDAMIRRAETGDFLQPQKSPEPSEQLDEKITSFSPRAMR